MFRTSSTAQCMLAPHTAIVSTLKEYNRPLPIDFLARILHQGESDLQENLRRLKEDDVVEFDGENVRLLGLKQ